MLQRTTEINSRKSHLKQPSPFSREDSKENRKSSKEKWFWTPELEHMSQKDKIN